MEEDGQLEAGEVAASPAKQPLPAAPTIGLPGGAAAIQRWEELEQQVRQGCACSALCLKAATSCVCTFSPAMHTPQPPSAFPYLQVRGMHVSGGGGTGAGTPWRGLTPTLYTTFWALQLYDLEVPTAR